VRRNHVRIRHRCPHVRHRQHIRYAMSLGVSG
jgi:hypothetical protein